MSKLKVDELQESTTDSNITVASGTNLVVTDSLTVDGASTFGEDVYNTTPNPTKLAVFGRFYCDIGDGYPFTVYDGSAGENLFLVDGGDCVKIDPEGQLGATEFGSGIDVSGASTFAGDVEIEDSVRLGPEQWSGQWGNHGGSGVSDCEIAAYGRTFFDIAHNTFTGAKGFDIYNSNEGEFMLRIDPNYLTFDIDPAGICDPVEFGGGIVVGQPPNPAAPSASFGGDVLPSADNSKDLGSSSKRWANLYVADAHYSNVGTGGNDVDGTEGSWTIQEGEEDLFLLNRKNGKKFKIKLEEIE